MAAVAVIAGGIIVWRVATPDRIDAEWVDSNFSAAKETQKSKDDTAKRYLRILDVTFGDGDIVQHQLRDGSWTSDGLATFLGRLDLAVTSQATAGDTRRAFLKSTADRAAEVTSRSIAALALRDDLDTIRDQFAEDDDATGSIAIGHLLGAWGTSWLLSDAGRAADDQPGAYIPQIGNIDDMSHAPLVSSAWKRQLLPLALTTDKGFAAFAGGMETAAARFLQSAREAQHESLTTKLGASSQVGRSMVGDVVLAWARVGHAVLSGPGDDDERSRRLSAWVDSAATLVDEVGDTLAPTGDDNPVPFAVFESSSAPWSASSIRDRIDDAEPIDAEAAAQRLDRARVLLTVTVIDTADAWKERPADFSLPPWDEAVTLDQGAWDKLVRTWQAGTPVALASSPFVRYATDALKGE